MVSKSQYLKEEKTFKKCKIFIQQQGNKKVFWMCSRSVNPHLLRSDPLHKTLDNTRFTLSLISIVEEKYWILHTGGKVFHILIQRSMLSSSIFFRCQYILAFTNEPSDIILSSNSETRYLLQSFMGELKIFLIVRFKKVFHFQNLCQHFVWNLSGIGSEGLLLAVAWEDSILVQESTGSSFWPNSGRWEGTLQLKKTAKWEKFLRRRRMALMMKALILDLHKNMRE